MRLRRRSPLLATATTMVTASQGSRRGPRSAGKDASAVGACAAGGPHRPSHAVFHAIGRTRRRSSAGLSAPKKARVGVSGALALRTQTLSSFPKRVLLASGEDARRLLVPVARRAASRVSMQTKATSTASLAPQVVMLQILRRPLLSKTLKQRRTRRRPRHRKRRMGRRRRRRRRRRKRRRRRRRRRERRRTRKWRRRSRRTTKRR
mmetsp:Transcript_135183/g.350294  ORF Transcript_135183/g.350294 Transcript_135183/m.350294 type:complete len:206 (-) Transcript_135183:425-1042(-)